MPRFDEGRLPRRHVNKGAEKAPMRAMPLGTGVVPENLDRLPGGGCTVTVRAPNDGEA